MTGVAERIATGVGSLLERRTSRRSVLSRAAVAGAAFAVAPVRLLVRPQSAWAVVVPDDCSTGLCTDGYTAFCCELEGGRNVCPANTYIAGWWKCTDYRGGGLCHSEGVRFYLDCNRTPHRGFPGGCQCAQGDCGRRRVDCNHFRYGQCNTQVQGTTEVVCRLIICTNPAGVNGLNCNGTEKVDDNTCSQEAGCLEGLAVQPGQAGDVMTVLVSVETVLLVLLLVLVAGLLRSHAELLRRIGPEGAAARNTGASAAGDVAPGLTSPDDAAVRVPDAPAPAISGVTLDGDPLVLDPSGAGGRPVLLAFLSTGCGTCREFFASLSPEAVAGVQSVIVTRGSDRERPARLRELAPPGVPLVMSSAAWESYAVPGSPYFVLADGSVRGEGVASTPEALISLVRDALDDVAIAAAPARARQIDEVLAAAGLRPDDPSLYPGERPEPG